MEGKGCRTRRTGAAPEELMLKAVERHGQACLGSHERGRRQRGRRPRFALRQSQTDPSIWTVCIVVRYFLKDLKVLNPYCSKGPIMDCQDM